MSVLIKGMEMPQNCDKCRFQSALKLYCDAMPYNFCGNTDDIERPDWCPLIGVPTQHGRLIDGDALINELASEHVGGLEAIKKYTNADTWTAGLHTAWRTIDDADTVIEAED